MRDVVVTNKCMDELADLEELYLVMLASQATREQLAFISLELQRRREKLYNEDAA